MTITDIKRETVVELFGPQNHLIGIFPDLDAARIYAMKRPAIRFLLEVWDGNSPRVLIHSEALNVSENPSQPVE